MQRDCAAAVEVLQPSTFQRMHQSAREITARGWNREGQSRGTYTGTSERSQQRQRQRARDKEEQDKKTRETYVIHTLSSQATHPSPSCRKDAMRFRDFFRPVQRQPPAPLNPPQSAAPLSDVTLPSANTHLVVSESIPFVLYDSELESEPESSCSESESDELATAAQAVNEPHISDSNEGDARTFCGQKRFLPQVETIRVHGYPVIVPPPRKRKKLDIPYRAARVLRKKQREEEAQKSLKDITRLLNSKKTEWDGSKVVSGRSLQAQRAQAIEAVLKMVVNDKERLMMAAQIAARYHSWSVAWSCRLVCRWTREWMKTRELPTSSCGFHGKTWSFLSDPTVRASIRAYLRSNKWAMNPGKLHEFLNNKMLPEEARRYGRDVVQHEMPTGLQKYIELEIFPHIHFKVKKKISLSTARSIMQEEGFAFTETKKGMYYDGHERPDIKEDCQRRFLPAMAAVRAQSIHYEPGAVDVESNEGAIENWQDYPMGTFIRPRYVVCAHDECTTQANDAHKKMWVLDGEQPIRKKGVGRGIHLSEVICSTVGHLVEAGQTLEYGKNHGGFWTGEKLVKQV
jgi:hypothetical protein